MKPSDGSIWKCNDNMIVFVTLQKIHLKNDFRLHLSLREGFPPGFLMVADASVKEGDEKRKSRNVFISEDSRERIGRGGRKR